MYFPNNINGPGGMYTGINQVPIQQPQGMYTNGMILPINQLPMQQMPYSIQQPAYGVNTNNPLFSLGQMTIQPYMDRQFLCNTFNYKVPYIEAFLSLSHEQKLKFFLIIQSRRLTGQLSSKQQYNQLLHKISSIVNPNYKQQKQQQQYTQVSQQQIKKKLLQRQFEQKCQWQMKKLVLEQNKNVFLSYDKSKIQNTQFSDWGSLGNESNNNKSISEQNQINKKLQYKKDNVIQQDNDQQFIYQQPLSQFTNNTTTQSSPLINQPFSSKITNNSNQQQQQWQQAQQLPNIDSKVTNRTNVSGSPKLAYSQSKLDSIWDVEINQQELRKTQPNIKQIFGVKRSQQDQFGGFEEANTQNVENNNEDFINVNIESYNNQPNTNYITNNIINFTKRQSPQKQLYSTQKTTTNYINNQYNNQYNINDNNINWLTTTQSSQHQLPQSLTLTYQPKQQQGSIQSLGQVNSGVISNINIDLDVDLIGGSNQNVYQYKEISQKKQQQSNMNMGFDYLGQLDTGMFGIKVNSTQGVNINNQNKFQYINQPTTTYVTNQPIITDLQSLSFPISTETQTIAINNITKQQQIKQHNINQQPWTFNYSQQHNNQLIYKKQQQQQNRQQQQEQQQWQIGEQVIPSQQQQQEQQQNITSNNLHEIINTLQPQHQRQHQQQPTINSNQQQHSNYLTNQLHNNVDKENSNPIFDFGQLSSSSPTSYNYNTNTINQQQTFTFDDMFINSDNYNSKNIVNHIGLYQQQQQPYNNIQQQQQYNNQQQQQQQYNNQQQQQQSNNNQQQQSKINQQQQQQQPQQAPTNTSPIKSQKSIKIIRKISRPPSNTQIQIPQSNYDDFIIVNNQNITNQLQTYYHQNNQLRNQLRRTSQRIKTTIQPLQQYQDLSKSQTIEPTYYINNLQNDYNVKQQPKQITTKKQLKLQQVSAINIAVNSSQTLPKKDQSISIINSPQHYQSKSMATSFVYDHNNNNNKIQQQHKQQKQKIISTYNKPMSYTPNSFTSTMKSMLTKSKLFFKSNTISKSASQQQNKEKNTTNKQSVGNDNDRLQKSMMQMSYNNNKTTLINSDNNNINKTTIMGNKRLDYSIDQNIDNINKDHQDIQQQQANQTKQQSIVSPSHNFKKKQSLQFKQSNKQLQQSQQLQIQQYNNITPQRLDSDILAKLSQISQQLIYKLPQSQLTYIQQQLVKNKFFFDKVFYIELRELLQKLSLKNQLPDYLRSIIKNNVIKNSNNRQSRSIDTYQTSQSKLFITEIQFLTQIIQKLNKIDQLNKQFTLAMEQDQQEQLAQVVFKSKQLTFQVNEDGQVAKKIAGLVVQNRLDNKRQRSIVVQDIDEETQKYNGVYYLLVKLLIVMPSSNTNTINYPTYYSIPQQYLTHLLQTFNTTISSSPSLSNKSQFLTQFITLYLLHNHLNQLQYIKNISQTIFSYLTKQHSILIQKINQIKRLSLKYNQSPQVIFTKLIQTMQMVEYLKGLGQMADVGDRVLEVTKRIGVKFDNNKNNQQQQQLFEQNKLRKIITECRQLAVKYNLIQNKSTVHNDQLSIYSLYLSQLLKSTTQQHTPQQTHKQINSLLKQHPICKVCLMPKSIQSSSIFNKQKQGEFISNAMIVSQQSMGSHSHIQWCHFTCYNMLKMAFQDLADSSMIE